MRLLLASILSVLSILLGGMLMAAADVCTVLPNGKPHLSCNEV